MKTVTLGARLFSAVFALAMTLGLFGHVVSIAEPQRSALMAKSQGIEQLPTAAADAVAVAVAVTVASNSVAPEGK